MDTYAVQRKIALLIKFLKHELKPEHRPELGDADLAKLLNETQSAPAQFRFTGARVNAFLHARKNKLKPGNEAAILSALQALINDRSRHSIDVSRDPPLWIEEQFAKELRSVLRHAASAITQGEHLGDKAALLSGAWSLFVVALPDRNATTPAIFRFGFLFRPYSATQMSLVMVSRKSEWRGAAHMNGSHLYMQLRDVADTKAASFITNLPVKQRLKFSGVALSVAPESQLVPNPALVGAVCCAEKWDAAAAGDSALAETIARLIEVRSHVSEADIQTVRQGFCKQYADREAFSRDYPSLYQYMTHHRINGEAGFPLHGLHVAF